MTSRIPKAPRILVIDVGGSHVKCASTANGRPRKFKSGPKLGPQGMVQQVKKITQGWRFDVVSIGYPGVVHEGKIARDPNNLGPGWIGFDFEKAFGCPVKLLNDAAMQALGAYSGGTMLFMGLGTGLGSALIVGGVIVPMELGHLRYSHGKNYEHFVGDEGRRRLGNKAWRRKVHHVVEGFRNALLPDYVVIGGGNAEHLKHLPPQTRLCDNADAFGGGLRLWERHTAQTATRDQR
jgi:predicted NBD/HSP70 family sugar kinase